MKRLSLRVFVLTTLVLAFGLHSSFPYFDVLLEAREELTADNFHLSEAVLWGQRLPTDEIKVNTAEKTEFEILAIAKDTSKEFKVGQKVVLDQTWDPSPTSTFILYKYKSPFDETYFWDSSGPVNLAAWNYMSKAPPLKTPASERLPYYFKHLDSTEEFISEDAFSEFNRSKFQDFAKVKDSMPRETLRKYFTNSKSGSHQQDLYGLLLGVSGNEEDAKHLFSLIQKLRGESLASFRGMMVGYLLLTGEKGLDKLEQTAPSIIDSSFHEKYSFLSAVSYLGKNAPEKIPAQRLRSTLRQLLTHPEMSDLVITTFSSLEDWSVVDELVAMYDQEDYERPYIKRAIIRYLWRCTHSWDEKNSSKLPDYVTSAKKALEKIEKSDPKFYRDTTLFFPLH